MDSVPQLRSSQSALAPTPAILHPLPVFSRMEDQRSGANPSSTSKVGRIPNRTPDQNQATQTHQSTVSLTNKRKETDRQSASALPCTDSLIRSDVPPSPLAKRPRRMDNSRIASVRSEIAKTARLLRKDGIPPVTVFFPSIPKDLQKDAQLRTAIGTGLQDLKTINAKGKKMAWATFVSESICLDTLLALRIHHPKLIASLHRPKQLQQQSVGGSSWSARDKNAMLFDKNVAAVLARGGLGNTLMFRNLPVEVDVAELEAILASSMRAANINCNVLRIRTALSKGRAGRNFWAVYPSIDVCKLAFIHLLLQKVSFRCGKTAKLHPIIHDDSTDADEKKRRERAVALGNHASRSRSSSIETSRMPNSIDGLEHFLRSTQKSFIFLSPHEKVNP